MRVSVRAVLATVALVISTAGVAAAAPQEPPKPPATPPPEAGPDRAVPTAVAVPTRDLFDLLRQEKIKPLIARRFPLAEARHAHELLGKGGVIGKFVLDVSTPEPAAP